LRSPARSSKSTRYLLLPADDVCRRPYPGPAAGAGAGGEPALRRSADSADSHR
jgi:hypothetical protein